MNIIFGGDIVPTKSNCHLFEEEKITELFGEELLSVLSSADYRIFNLETPLCDFDHPIIKNGGCLRASTNSCKALRSIQVNVVTLANNHCMDQGTDGLLSTFKTLRDNCIEWVGAGQNLQESNIPKILNLGQNRVGIYACAEHEFSIGSENTSGANPYDPLTSFDDIKDLKKACDFVVVLYHGGKEYYPYPSPNLQRICRKFVNCGANLVLCQHSHCVGAVERTSGGTILYGQGNFLFDDGEMKCLQTGLLVSVDHNLKLELIPVKKVKNTVRLAKGADKERILGDLENRSEEIKSKEFVENSYREFADSFLSYYLKALNGNTTESLLFRCFNRITRRFVEDIYLKQKYPVRSLVKLQNYIECEAHHELLLEAIKNRLSLLEERSDTR